MRDKESKSGVWSYGDSPRETLIFQAICGCSPIAMPSVGRRNEITVRTKFWSVCCSGVAGKITNVRRLRPSAWEIML